MSTAVAAFEKPLTAEEFLALPDDGRARWLIGGVLHPADELEMSLRNKRHSLVTTNIAFVLKAWRDQQPMPRGQVHTGDAAFRLRKNPDTLVGIDLAYATAELVAVGAEDAPYFDGPPKLAVEILSPSDRHQELVKKLAAYSEAGVTVWVVDPDLRTVTTHRPGRGPEMVNETQDLSGEPELPGFRIAVARLFEP